jgi:hypothetical protein
MADAKKANLVERSDSWKKYPDDMLMHRAWGRLHKHLFSDVTMGLATVEELRDVPPEPEPPQLLPPEKDPLLEQVAAQSEDSSEQPPTIMYVDADPSGLGGRDVVLDEKPAAEDEGNPDLEPDQEIFDF